MHFRRTGTNARQNRAAAIQETNMTDGRNSNSSDSNSRGNILAAAPANEAAQIQRLIDDGALFVFSDSGGKDSQAMMIKLIKIVPAKQVLVVHATLGEVEWEGALEHAEERAQKAGVPFVVAQAVKSLTDMVEHRFAVRPDAPSWPSASNRQCTSDLKRGPIEREIRRYMKATGYKKIVSCMGLRAEESHSRAKLATFRRNKRNSVAGRDWYDWLPVHSMLIDEVFATIKAAGQKPHWAYAAGNERLSCVFCIMASGRDLANGAKHNPDLYAKYIALEQKTGYTMHMSRKSLPELVARASNELEAGLETEPCDVYFDFETEPCDVYLEDASVAIAGDEAETAETTKTTGTTKTTNGIGGRSVMAPG